MIQIALLGLRPWKLAFLSQALSSAVVAVLLLMIALFGWFDRGLGPLLERMRAEQVITAYLAPPESGTPETTTESAVLERIQAAVGAGGRLRVIGPTEFLEELRGKDYATLASELEEMGEELSTIVPRYVSLEGEFDAQALERVSAVAGVESAESSRGRFAAIVGAFDSVRWAIRALMVGLALALVTGLVHLGRINAQIHAEALRLLRHWGAGRLMLAAPILVSGASVGVLGGALAAGLWLTVGVQFAKQLKSLSPLLSTLPDASPALALPLAAIGLLIGLVSTGARVRV